MKKMLAKSEKLVFREASTNDVDDMTELEEICFLTPWTKSDLEKEIKSNALAIYIVAELDGTVIGYAGVWCIVDEGHITNVAVHPDYRKQGIGKNLVEIMIYKLEKKSGIKSFTLEVRESNEIAINLYRGLGFKEAGTRKKYYSDNGEDAIIMWRI